MSDPQMPSRPDRCEKRHGARSELLITDTTRHAVDDVGGRVGTFERAIVVDIGLGGVAIETQKYSQVGRSYPLTFKCPTGPLRLEGTIAWSRLIRTLAVAKTEVQPVFVAGFQFSNLSAAQRERLELSIADAVGQSTVNGEEKQADVGA